MYEIVSTLAISRELLCPRKLTACVQLLCKCSWTVTAPVAFLFDWYCDGDSFELQWSPPPYGKRNHKPFDTILVASGIPIHVHHRGPSGVRDSNKWQREINLRCAGGLLLETVSLAANLQDELEAPIRSKFARPDFFLGSRPNAHRSYFPPSSVVILKMLGVNVSQKFKRIFEFIKICGDWILLM